MDTDIVLIACRWRPENVHKTWFIDALTIHPKKLNDLVRGIWERGKRQPVQTSAITVSDTDLPSVMVYIAVHCDFGVRAFIPATGSHGGIREGMPSCHSAGNSVDLSVLCMSVWKSACLHPAYRMIAACSWWQQL